VASGSAARRGLRRMLDEMMRESQLHPIADQRPQPNNLRRGVRSPIRRWLRDQLAVREDARRPSKSATLRSSPAPCRDSADSCSGVRCCRSRALARNFVLARRTRESSPTRWGGGLMYRGRRPTHAHQAQNEVGARCGRKKSRRGKHVRARCSRKSRARCVAAPLQHAGLHARQATSVQKDGSSGRAGLGSPALPFAHVMGQACCVPRSRAAAGRRARTRWTLPFGAQAQPGPPAK